MVWQVVYRVVDHVQDLLGKLLPLSVSTISRIHYIIYMFVSFEQQWTLRVHHYVDCMLVSQVEYAEQGAAEVLEVSTTHLRPPVSPCTSLHLPISHYCAVYDESLSNITHYTRDVGVSHTGQTQEFSSSQCCGVQGEVSQGMHWIVNEVIT